MTASPGRFPTKPRTDLENSYVGKAYLLVGGNGSLPGRGSLGALDGDGSDGAQGPGVDGNGTHLPSLLDKAYYKPAPGGPKGRRARSKSTSGLR
ncbi:hypothetical protein HYH03_004192 [Edaphochlamys debaryana]|uniref:Uncharacterized protein n=1 Tax=Edaphochlamys debaryana TaxID=47281 RepID=A0A835YFS4_9CHLO|nr:hypothetical protein HYH03_004192 [Edaphochlamys debaryana]|eukprot:KAG2497930.1 hypothetical protein HYH03_004192 [Edaphochlamys debaryana]